MAGKTGKGIIERRGGTLSTYTVQESESLRAQNSRLIFRPTRQGNPEKESLRGGEVLLSTYTVQESEGLRAQNIQMMCRPTWGDNRKRNH